jgi:hypothetical protein
MPLFTCAGRNSRPGLTIRIDVIAEFRHQPNGFGIAPRNRWKGFAERIAAGFVLRSSVPQPDVSNLTARSSLLQSGVFRDLNAVNNDLDITRTDRVNAMKPLQVHDEIKALHLRRYGQQPVKRPGDLAP